MSVEPLDTASTDGYFVMEMDVADGNRLDRGPGMRLM